MILAAHCNLCEWIMMLEICVCEMLFFTSIVSPLYRIERRTKRKYAKKVKYYFKTHFFRSAWWKRPIFSFHRFWLCNRIISLACTWTQVSTPASNDAGRDLWAQRKLSTETRKKRGQAKSIIHASTSFLFPSPITSSYLNNWREQICAQLYSSPRRRQRFEITQS